jgi:bacterioferritin-associated ferredoxin
MYVCLCKALTEGDLESLVKTVGPDFDAIQACSGVSTDCGSCLIKAERVVREVAKQDSRETATASARV